MSSTFIDCPANTWTLIATNKTSGIVHKVSVKPSIYLQAFVDTGGGAPIGRSVGVKAFQDSLSNGTEEISSSQPIDVYIWADKFPGRVRVDA